MGQPPDRGVPDRASDVTMLLRAWGDDDLHARDDLLPLVCRELRKHAAGYLRLTRES